MPDGTTSARVLVTNLHNHTAFALIGAGMLALAAAMPRPGHRAQLGCAIAIALVIPITAASYATGSDNFSDLMLFISGLLALPLWLIGTGRIGSFSARTQDRRAMTRAHDDVP